MSQRNESQPVHGTAGELIQVGAYWTGAETVVRVEVFEHGLDNDPTSTVDIDGAQAHTMVEALLDAIYDIARGEHDD